MATAYWYSKEHIRLRRTRFDGLAALGALRIIFRYGTSAAPPKLIVNRAQLFEMVRGLKLSAQHSVTNFAGDLSWLYDELPLLKTLREGGADKQIQIFFNRLEVEDSPIVAQARQLGARIIPYPLGLEVPFRGLIIDVELESDCQVLLINKVARRPWSLGSEEYEYSVDHHTAASNAPFVRTARMLYNVLMRPPIPRLKIGITGLNNVGKTSVAAGVARLLENKWRTSLVSDSFRVLAPRVDFAANLEMLFLQFVSEVDASMRSDVIVCDRTLIDNFIFMKMRNTENEDMLRFLEPLVVRYARSYDRLFYLSPGNEIVSSKHLSVSERTLVLRMFNDFLHHNSIGVIEVRVESVSAAVQQIVKHVEQMTARGLR